MVRVLFPHLFFFLLPVLVQIYGTQGANRDRVPQLDLSNSEIYQLVDELRQNDENRASSSQIRIDYQGHTSTRDGTDNAPSPFFKQVDDHLLAKGTYSKLIQLFDNYNFETGVAEDDTAQEREEVREFLDAVLETKPFKLLIRLLREKEYPMADSERTFRAWLSQLWFGPYSRARGQPDSSGFEHVFIGEAKNAEISGMHNWVRFYYLERSRRNFDYKGFLVKRFKLMGAVKYSLGAYLKRSGSFLIGTSPEFDMALYTLCFLSRRGHSSTCNFEIDGCPVSITSFDLRQQGKVFIGSMYPSAGRMTAECRAKNERPGN